VVVIGGVDGYIFSFKIFVCLALFNYYKLMNIQTEMRKLSKKVKLKRRNKVILYKVFKRKCVIFKY